jgi:hypothetical protein
MPTVLRQGVITPAVMHAPPCMIMTMVYCDDRQASLVIF